jgi:hypothetical protein
LAFPAKQADFELKIECRVRELSWAGERRPLRTGGMVARRYGTFTRLSMNSQLKQE